MCRSRSGDPPDLGARSGDAVDLHHPLQRVPATRPGARARWAYVADPRRDCRMGRLRAPDRLLGGPCCAAPIEPLSDPSRASPPLPTTDRVQRQVARSPIYVPMSQECHTSPELSPEASAVADSVRSSSRAVLSPRPPRVQLLRLVARMPFDGFAGDAQRHAVFLFVHADQTLVYAALFSAQRRAAVRGMPDRPRCSAICGQTQDLPAIACSRRLLPGDRVDAFACSGHPRGDRVVRRHADCPPPASWRALR